jgi:hypothetical protein
MKLIKKINRSISEDLDAQLIDHLDQEDAPQPDEVIAQNIKEVEKQAAQDKKTVIKDINKGEREEPIDKVKPIKEDMADAMRQAEQIRADAEIKVAEVMASATAAEAVKQAELDALAKENLLTDILAGLTKSVWELVDAYQNAISAIKANNIENADSIGAALEEIVNEEYIHVGTIQGLAKQQIDDFAEKAEEGEDAVDPIADTVDDELPLDGEAEVIDAVEINDEEPEPVEVTDLDGFHADAEIEDAPQLVDGEPAAVEVSDDDLQ